MNTLTEQLLTWGYYEYKNPLKPFNPKGIKISLIKMLAEQKLAQPGKIGLAGPVIRELLKQKGITRSNRRINQTLQTLEQNQIIKKVSTDPYPRRIYWALTQFGLETANKYEN